MNIKLHEHKASVSPCRTDGIVMASLLGITFESPLFQDKLNDQVTRMRVKSEEGRIAVRPISILVI